MFASCPGVNGPTGGHMMLNLEAFARPSITTASLYNRRASSCPVRRGEALHPAPAAAAMKVRRESIPMYYHGNPRLELLPFRHPGLRDEHRFPLGPFILMRCAGWFSASFSRALARRRLR